MASSMRQVPPWLVRGRAVEVAEVRLGLWDMVSIPGRASVWSAWPYLADLAINQQSMSHSN
jgi:hypothetical protein